MTAAERADLLIARTALHDAHLRAREALDALERLPLSNSLVLAIEQATHTRCSVYLALGILRGMADEVASEGPAPW